DCLSPWVAVTASRASLAVRSLRSHGLPGKGSDGRLVLGISGGSSVELHRSADGGRTREGVATVGFARTDPDRAARVSIGGEAWWAAESSHAGVRLAQTLDGAAHRRPLVEDGEPVASAPGSPRP
ncbi:MAG: hypothetical protein ACRDKW_11495, partial [Actinomycetota bacterium]